MDFGYCINCWWYKPIKGKHWVVTKKGLVEKLGNGECYMHNGGNSDQVDYTVVDGSCYCPDYYNRKRGNKEQKMTLEEWINEGLNKNA